MSELIMGPGSLAELAGMQLFCPSHSSIIGMSGIWDIIGGASVADVDGGGSSSSTVMLGGGDIVGRAVIVMDGTGAVVVVGLAVGITAVIVGVATGAGVIVMLTDGTLVVGPSAGALVVGIMVDAPTPTPLFVIEPSSPPAQAPAIRTPAARVRAKDDDWTKRMSQAPGTRAACSHETPMVSWVNRLDALAPQPSYRAAPKSSTLDD
jgi:hypothetical protein